MRLGSLRSIDLEDYDRDAKCIDLKHRPDQGTPLKNGVAAERSINISDHFCQVLDDYIEYTRDDVEDDFGREPLITSTKGRLTASPIR